MGGQISQKGQEACNAPEMEEIKHAIGIDARGTANWWIIRSIACRVRQTLWRCLHSTVLFCNAGVGGLDATVGPASLFGLRFNILTVFRRAARLARVLLSDLGVMRGVHAIRCCVCGVGPRACSLARRNASVIDGVTGAMLATRVVRG